MRAFPNDFRLLLASQSPRRSDILASLGVPFTTVPSRAQERMAGAAPGDLAEANALAKAREAEIPSGAAGSFVLGTDTVVVVDGRPLGKPANESDARGMLRLLSGREHEVISGVALLRGGQEAVACASTMVAFEEIGEDSLAAYLASGEWRGKAGAYAIQGLAGMWVPEIRGEYQNVVGLPVHLLRVLFRRLGFDLFSRRWLEDSGRPS